MSCHDARHGKSKKTGKSRRIIIVPLLCALLCLVACSTPVSILKEQPSAELKWPRGPHSPKIQWVKTIADSQDAGIQKGFWKKALEFIIGEDPHRIVRPHGVLFDSNERLFIADPGAGLVHFMDTKAGNYILIGEKVGSPLRTPIGLAEDDNNRLYISDSTTGQVYCYDLQQHTLTALLKRTLGRPTGIAYSRAMKLLYIIDTLNGQVVAVDQSGAEKIKFGATGEATGMFNHPTDIAVDGRGQLYITDPLNYKIKVFTPEGKLLKQFGAAGDMPGDLNKPKGVAVDSEGHIYVSDALFDAVQIFDQDGLLLLSFGSRGSANGDFWMPSGIAVDAHDYIFVADTYNQRVQVFRYLK